MMLKTIGALATAVFLSNAAHGTEITSGVEPKDAIFHNEQLWYQVAGTGRLYLYSGPDEKCINKSLFVVPGDSLIAYKEYGKDGEWSSVMYLSKSGKNVDGWVHTKRLRFIGASGGDMTPGAVKFYEKAAEAAKNGKLGHPE